MAGCDDDGAPVPGTSLEGLGLKWEADSDLRTQVLQTKSLLKWPSPKKTGVISFETVALNAKIICMTLEVWCPQVSEAKTVHIDHVRSEVRGLTKNIL